MKKNITIRDVAKEAGVSVATVSYVINERDDKRISEKTRKKVLQIVNLLGYIPNQSAKALATSKSGMIALYVAPGCSLLKHAQQLYFINYLSSCLVEKNYNLIYLNSNYTEKFDHADAIICYDVSSDYFCQIGDNNFVPLIALDCIIHEPGLFFQINSDFEKLSCQAKDYFQSKDFILLMLETQNLELKDYLKSLFSQIIYVNDFTDIASLPQQNFLVVEQALYNCLKHSNKICYLPGLTAAKGDILLQCIDTALKRTPVEQHHIFI